MVILQQNSDNTVTLKITDTNQDELFTGATVTLTIEAFNRVVIFAGVMAEGNPGEYSAKVPASNLEKAGRISLMVTATDGDNTRSERFDGRVE